MENKSLFEYGKKLGYRIEPDGRIIGSDGVEIQGYVKKDGYRYFTIRQPASEGRRKARIVKVHRFQAYQKYGDVIFTKGIHVRHKDENKSNNSWENILIGSAHDNQMDIAKEKRIARATHASSFARRFTEEQMNEIVRLRESEKLSYIQIAIRMGVKSKGHIHWIINNRNKPV